MKHFLLYGHGGSYNHGAEAIVKTTIEIIREKYSDAYITLSSHFPEQDREFSINADEIIAPDYAAWKKEKSAVEKEKEEFAALMYAEALERITRDTTLYSIGGDNYCYPNWHRLKVFQDESKRKHAKSVLWSTSIESSAITLEMAEVLNSYDTIAARESRTYNALREYGITCEISLMPDVAFNLKPESVDFPIGFEKGKLVGINISPLVIRRETTKGILKKNILTLVDYILSETEYKIAFIPHVVIPVDNDYAALSDIYDTLTAVQRERVWLASDKFSAAQYKYIISQCQSLLCSRTHASIAAYSSGVPCAVIGYSVKSIGIAEDLGKGDFVLHVDRIVNDNDIMDLWRKISW